VNQTVDQHSGRPMRPCPLRHVVGAINRRPRTDTVVTAAAAAGRADQELAHQVGRHLRLRVRFLLMGYEIPRLGHQMAHPDREVVVFVGDGSYLMMTPTSTARADGHKLIIVVCDNAVIRHNRLQVFKGSPPSTT